MTARELGRTGLTVPRLGLGLAALGRPGYVNLGHAEDLEHHYEVETMRARTHDVLDEAWRLGVRYFDAARSYGRAEEFLAGWLASRSVEPRDVVVGSKWGYTYTAGWRVEAEHHEIKDHSLPTLRAQIGESRALLGAHLDLYQIHSVTPESGVLVDATVLAELAHLRETGVRVGLTLSGPSQAEVLLRALDVRVDGRLLFQTVQATWNLLERSAGAALQAAHDAGLGVIVKEALANGLLTERNHDPAFAGRRRVLSALARDRGTTMDAVALGAVLAQPWADVVLSGAASVEHLRSNLQGLDLVWSEELERELAALGQPPEDYWAIRRRLAWN